MTEWLDWEAEKNKKNPKPKPKQRVRKKRFEWPAEPFDTARHEAALWVAVITQAMMDALSNANSVDAPRQKDEAIRWLTGNSKDFTTVCHYAGLDPDYVRRKAKRALIRKVRWRAEPGQGSRYTERRLKRLLTEKANGDEESGCNVISGPWLHNCASSI